MLFMIAPVRAQLCSEKENGRIMDSKSWRWCYDKDFRLTLDELDQKIEGIMEPCNRLIENFIKHQKTGCIIKSRNFYKVTDKI